VRMVIYIFGINKWKSFDQELGNLVDMTKEVLNRLESMISDKNILIGMHREK